MLSFAAMLNTVVTPDDRSRAGEKKRKHGVPRGQQTPEMVAKRKATLRLRRNKRWHAAFKQYGGRATCAQLSLHLGYSIISTNASLTRMRKEVPPVVTVVEGTHPFLYVWIGEDYE